MLGKQIQERRELQTNKCNFNSQKSQRNGGGRYLISSASILNTLQYIYIYIFKEGRLQTKQCNNLNLTRKGAIGLTTNSPFYMGVYSL